MGVGGPPPQGVRGWGTPPTGGSRNSLPDGYGKFRGGVPRGWCPRIGKWAKNGVKNGSKRLKNGHFGPFSTIFRHFSANVDFGQSFEIPCTMCRCEIFQKKKNGDGILRYEGSKSGILET